MISRMPPLALVLAAASLSGGQAPPPSFRPAVCEAPMGRCHIRTEQASPALWMITLACPREGVGMVISSTVAATTLVQTMPDGSRCPR